MRALILLFAFAACVACSDSSKKAAKENNSDAQVDDNSGKNISPQITPDSTAQNSVDVDTISSAKSAQEQKE